MAYSYLKRIAHGNASSSSLPASSSSNVPTQAVGSASNNAASVKGKSKFGNFFHRGRRSHTNKTGDVAATSSRSASPVLQANKSSTSSQPLANAQTTTIKDSPDTKNLADTSSGNKTANAALILEIVKNICEVLDKVPYVKVVTGLATTAIAIIEAVNACKEEWDKVKDDLNKVRDVVFKFRHGRDDSAPLPDDVTDAFRELEICLREVLDAVIRYRDVSAGRLVLERSALKAEATSCVGRIDIAIKVFEMKVLVGMRLVGDQTHHIVEKILTIVLSTQQGPTPSSSLNLNVLACPAPSQYFTGRESDLRKLSRMLAAPVVTLFSMNSNALSAFVRSFDHSSRFTAIFLDASSVEALSIGLKEIVHNIKPNNSTHQPPLLVLENADPSLELDQYLPYSLHNPILVTSTNKAVSHLASPACEFELLDYTDQWAADSLYQSIERAFAPLLHVVTIIARGGTGKTQLVLKFVSEDPSRFIHVWFFDASSDATLAAGFKKLSKAAGIDESVNNVQDFLRRMQEDWLLIFDNADDPNIELSKYIPQCSHGNIIITSRLTDQIASPGACFNFSDLEQSDAVNLLLKHAHEDFNINNQQLASYIVDALGCQALAVATAGAYITSTATCTLGNYLSLFKQKSKQLLNYKMKSFDGYQKTVFNAFQLSFGQLSSSTKLFMQICAFFHHTAIPVELFYQAAAFTGYDLEPEEKEKTPAIEELKDFLSLFTHEWSWNDSIDELSRFSLTIYNTGVKALSFHPILHICVQKTIVNKKKLYDIALFLLARATPDSNTDIDYQFRQILLAHADYIYQNNLCTFLTYSSLGRIFEDAGLWERAKHIYQKALKHCECYFEKHHFNTLTSMSNLGNMYIKLGQLEKAKVLQTETLKLRKEVLGEHHPNTLSSMGNLALTYRQLGQWEEAKVLQTETLKLCKEVLGEHHPNTLLSMSNLALTYCQLRQWEEAKVLQTETLKLCKEVLGEHHPDTLSSMDNLASVYYQLGQWKEAKVLQIETLKLCKEVLGEHHPDTLSSMDNLALVYYQLGQWKEAKVLQTETLKLCKEVLGEYHPDTLSSMDNLASAYYQLGQWKEAKVLQTETLKLCKEVLGEHHPNTLSSIGNLALTYHQLGQWEEAKMLQIETLKLHKEVLGEHHPNTLLSMGNLALTYHQLEQLEEAKVLQTETFKLCKEVLGEHHPNTLLSMGNLALTYHQLGQLEEAKVLQTETLKLHKEVLGEHHPNTLLSIGNLALTYHQLGQLEEAKVLQTETFKLCKEVLGEHHSNTLLSMGNLALTYHQLGQLEEAKVLQTETLKLCKDILGEHHPNTLLSMGNLALAYHQLRQLEEARMLQTETLKLCKEVLGEHHPDTLLSMKNLAYVANFEK